MVKWIVGFLLVATVIAVPLAYKREKHTRLRNFRVVDEGRLYRSGQLSPAGLEQVCRERGIRTVIKLREASEKEKDQKIDEAEAAFCRDHGIAFHRRIPLDWEVDPAGKVPAEANLRWFESLLDDEAAAPKPILVHCFAGIHRTGAMVVAYRMKVNGWSNDEAVGEFVDCGYSTSTYVGNILPYLRSYRPKP